MIRKLRLTNRLLASLVLVHLLVLPGVSVSHAQIASALIREGDTLPGDPSGFLISDINSYNAQNGVGGFAFNVETFDAAGTGSIDHIWGNTIGGSGTVLRTQSTFGDFQQTGFGHIGMSDAGMLAYRGISTNTVSGSTDLHGLWLDSTLILNAGDSISTLPGNFSTYNTSVDITREGTPYWKGRYSTTQGEARFDSKSAIFFGIGQTVLLKSGDTISGISERVTASAGNSTIGLHLRFSANGTNYINEVQVGVDTPSSPPGGIIVSNGAALLAGGSVIRQESPIPTSAGGLAGEMYGSFDDFGITESGAFLITGRTRVESRNFLMIDGEIVLREGDVIDGLTLNGAIELAVLNEDGDWAAVWDVDFGEENFEALIVNGEIALLEGDLIDWNNDGLIDGSDQNGFISNFSPVSRALTLSDRDANGDVRLLFNADVILDDTMLEGGFSMSLSTALEPASVGDFDTDGDTDGHDFLAWQRGESPESLSELNLAAWQANFGAAGSLLSGIAVPEPSSASLAVLMLTCLAALTRKAIRERGCGANDRNYQRI